MDNKIISFKGYLCTIHKFRYSNNNLALMLRDANDGSPITKATINIPQAELKVDEVIIKDYAENEGLLDVLVKEGIVESPHDFYQAGYVKVPICKIKI